MRSIWRIVNCAFVTLTRKFLYLALVLWGTFDIRCENAFCYSSGILQLRLPAVLRDGSFNHFREDHQFFHFADAPRRPHAFCCQAHWPWISNAEPHRLPLARYAGSCNRRVSVTHDPRPPPNETAALCFTTDTTNPRPWRYRSRPVGKPSCLEVAVERACHRPNSRQSQLASALHTDPELTHCRGKPNGRRWLRFVFDVW